jgi:hypothetical protein
MVTFANPEPVGVQLALMLAVELATVESVIELHDGPTFVVMPAETLGHALLVAYPVTVTLHPPVGASHAQLQLVLIVASIAPATFVSAPIPAGQEPAPGCGLPVLNAIGPSHGEGGCTHAPLPHTDPLLDELDELDDELELLVLELVELLVELVLLLLVDVAPPVPELVPLLVDVAPPVLVLVDMPPVGWSL